MTTVTYMPPPTPHPVDEDEGFRMLDAQAWRRLNMSGEEFLQRWDAGDFSGPESDRPDVVRVAMLIPLAR